MPERIAHFNIGPVQDFVAKARRTRDLWAGSFLLSWLAGQLMAAVLRQNAQIRFPDVGTERDPKEPMLAAILGKPLPECDPRIGSLPNRFKAAVPENFDPDAAVDEAKSKWRELAVRVWRCDIEQIAGMGRNTRDIWGRQIDGFWDFQWILADDPGDGSDAEWLGRRKNWRSHWPAEEGGDHCTTMGDLQEISGFIRSREKAEQDEFWNSLRKRDRIGRLNFRDDERLCAVALVKRLFPQLPGADLKQSIGWSFDATNWPSTVYMAAVPWLAHIAECPNRRAKLDVYVGTVREAVDQSTFSRLSGERATRLPRLENLGTAADLDGNLFVKTALLNARATPLSDSPPPVAKENSDPDRDRRVKLANALENLGKHVGSAQPFYALLLMDGDSLGAILGSGCERTVSQSLADFVRKVPRKVRCHDGMTVYAGGDDVLAMLPVDKAIECSLALSQEFGRAFSGFKTKDGQAKKVTASSAIIISHYRNPLRDVLALAHKELDETAKNQNGRDSLAVAIMLPGGVNRRWVSRFGTATEALAELKRREFPASFLYNLQQRYGSFLRELDQDDLREIVLAEYNGSNDSELEEKQSDSKTNVDALLAACTTDGESKQTGFQLEGAFIGRFLANILDFGPAAHLS